MAGSRLRGFSLLEVLVALVVVATALAGSMGAVSRSAKDLSHLDEVTLAQWVLDNTLSRIQLQSETLSAGSHEFSEVMLGRPFTVIADIERPPRLPLLTATVSVFAGARPERMLATASVRLVVEPASEQ